MNDTLIFWAVVGTMLAVLFTLMHFISAHYRKQYDEYIEQRGRYLDWLEDVHAHQREKAKDIYRVPYGRM